MSTQAVQRFVVVGASLAGVRTVAALRRAGCAAAITLVGAEPHPPYDRPPLSKQYLAGELLDNELELCDEPTLQSLDVDLRTGTRAEALDLPGRRIRLSDGTFLGFDRLVVATGADPVIPPTFRGRSGVTGYRTLEDAILLRDRLASGARVAVVGGGLIGAEIASTARRCGYDIDLVEAERQPMQRALGATIGAYVAAMLTADGVRLHLGAAVTAVRGTGRVRALELGDGTRIEADHVIVSVGVRPNTDWLAGCGLELSDGVRCDPRGAAIGGDGVVFAVGDVAHRVLPGVEGGPRVEHWTNVVETAPIVARGVLGHSADDPSVLPYFWSDQCGTKIQMFGRVGPDDEVFVVRRDEDARRLLALYRRDGQASAAVAFGMPRDLMALRGLIGTTPWDDVLAAARAGPAPRARRQAASTPDVAGRRW